VKRRLREKKCILGRAWSFVVVRLDKRSTFDGSSRTALVILRLG